jgi:D-alanyl-D-alanine carboxypeptidase
VRTIRALLLGVLLSLAAAPATAVHAGDPRLADWLRTVRETALWSGPADPSVQFTVLPVGSFLHPRAGGEQGRLLVYYPGDSSARQAGLAWIPADDVAPSGPPPWIVASELDGDGAGPAPPGAPRRETPVAPPVVSATEVAVVDGGSGLMLYGRSPHSREAPASTTKIVTALVTLLRASSLDTPVRVTVDGWAMAIADGSSIMGLSPGQRLTLRTLLYGLLLPSGNDAAEQLSVSMAESRGEFIAAMNALSTEMDLKDTHFVNPSGLDADGHYSSAYDLAQLARRAMSDEVFRDIVATPAINLEGLVLAGHNPLIGAYPGADGVKTGTTDAAGKAIVGSAVRDGHRVFVVVLHSQDILADSSALFNWVWQSFSW